MHVGAQIVLCHECTTTIQRSRRAPTGHLLLPNQFQKRLNCLLLIFFWPISEEKQLGDSRVSLHDVVFLIDQFNNPENYSV